MQEMQNGESLRSDLHEQLASGIKRYYAPLHIFGTIFFIMTCLGMAGFLKSFFIDDAYSEGLFGALPVFRWFVLFFSVLFIGGLMLGTYQMMMIPKRKAKQIDNYDFLWRYGYLTNKERYNNKASIWIDGERCLCLGMNLMDYDKAKLGDGFLLVYVSTKNPVKFGMRI